MSIYVHRSDITFFLWKLTRYYRNSGAFCNCNGQSVVMVYSLSARSKLSLYWYPADVLWSSDRGRTWTSHCLSPQALCWSWQQSPGSKPLEIMADIQSGNVVTQRKQNHSPAGGTSHVNWVETQHWLCRTYIFKASTSTSTSVSELQTSSYLWSCLLHWLHCTVHIHGDIAC